MKKFFFILTMLLVSLAHAQSIPMQEATAAQVTAGTAGVSYYVSPRRLPAANTALRPANNLSDVANAATARTNLGLAIGTNVQAYSSVLDSWATKAVPAGTIADLSTSQAFTNKTYNGNTITSGTGTLTLGSVTLNAGGGGTLGSAAFTNTSAYEVPLTFSTGLTRTTNTITVNLTTAFTWTGLHIFNSTSGLGVGAAPSTAPNSIGTLVYMTRTTAPATSTVGTLQYDYYALTPVDNTTVNVGILGDIQLNGSGTSGTGHSIAGIFRATDTSSNAGGQFSGLEGKRVCLSNTNNGAALFAVSDYNSASSMSGVVNQGLNFLMEHFNGSTSTPVAAGEMDLITAQTPIGGDTTKMYGMKLGANWQIDVGNTITVRKPSDLTQALTFQQGQVSGSDALIASTGNIYFNPAGGTTAFVGSVVPFSNGGALGSTGNRFALTATTVVANGALTFSGAATANTTVATVLGSVGPAGAHTTVQKWLAWSDGTNTYYSPGF